MKRLLTLLTLFAIITSISTAQIKISGTIVDTDTHDALEFVNIALLNQDSTFVAGASSDTKGLLPSIIYQPEIIYYPPHL